MPTWTAHPDPREAPEGVQYAYLTEESTGRIVPAMVYDGQVWIQTPKEDIPATPEQVKAMRQADLLPPWHEVIPAAHARGLTSREIAAETGFTYRTVRQYLYKLGLPSNKRWPRTGWEDRLRELHAQGLTTPEIMAEMGWTLDYTRKCLSRLKLPANRLPPEV